MSNTETPIHDQMVLESYQQDPEGRALAAAILNSPRVVRTFDIHGRRIERADTRRTLAVWFGWVKP